MKFKHKFKIVIISILSLVLLQNCSDKSLTSQEDLSSISDPNLNVSYNCSIGNEIINENDSKLFYLSSSVRYGSTCQSENRTCVKGFFAGTYQYTTCEVDAPLSCLHNGDTVSHGQSITTYLMPSVPFGQSCTQQQRTCTNGVLSGSYDYTSCTVGAPASCLFNGVQRAHGASVTAYLASTVSYGNTCQSESRNCYNGTLSGSYTFASCAVGVSASCLFNGVQYAHGASVTAFLTSTVSYGYTCQSESRICNNGTLSGSYTFASCSGGGSANCLFNGIQYAHGASVTAYLESNVSYGGTCYSESRTCNNGSLGGTYTNASCTIAPAANCVAAYGTVTVNHGQNITAYSAANSPYPGGLCSYISQTRSCNNGTLSGTYDFFSCSN